MRIIAAAPERTYSVFCPCWLDRPSLANSASAAARSASAARSGSAAVTLPATRLWNRLQPSRPSA